MSLKHHIAVKFIAVFLAALSLLAAVSSAVGVIGMASQNLYEISVDELYEEKTAGIRRSFAVNLIHRYASLNLGNIPEAYLDDYHGSFWLYDTFEYNQYCYAIKDENGQIVESTLFDDLEGASYYEINVTDIRYRRLIQSMQDPEPDKTGGETDAALPSEDLTVITEQDTTTAAPSDPTETAPVETAVTEPDATTVQTPAPASEDTEPIVYQDGYYDYELDIYVELLYQYADLPPYTVELYLFPGAMAEEPLWDLLKEVWQYRVELFYVLGVSLLLFAVMAVYLCCAAGKKPGSDEIRPGGLNCIPLDLYLFGGGFGILLIIALIVNVASVFAYHAPQILVPFVALTGYAGCLLFVGFCFACAAQFKTPGGYWWKHTVIGWCLRLIARGFRALIQMLPVAWQWLLISFLMALSLVVSFFLWLNPFSALIRFFFMCCFFASLLVCIAVICYGAWCMATLIKGARFMAQGNLHYQIPIKYLYGAFRDCAIQLNSLAGATSIAAERQLRSERMKTELITNVSHDIKTPLTSIINYVDLLKKPHSEEEYRQYLEVLDRQSQRLKKLIDDLMEMSKASTGNMNVDITRINAGESVNQALGEFADKLERAQLYPVFRGPENPVFMRADGRLVWRVMSNLLSNAVKYALPGTRLYIDLMELEGRVVISFKNISQEALNVSADDLMERFVRGDTSRNTEGSGLGLNIAKSLMELQRGQLQLLVDGDLFKVTLIFPADRDS